MKATGFITLLFALGFLLTGIAFSDVPEPCYLFDPDSTFYGPDYGGKYDDELCPGVSVIYEYYFRQTASGDHEVQITRLWLEPPDGDCSFEDMLEIALRDYFNEDPHGCFKKPDSCWSALISSISSCMEEAIDTGPPDVPDHFPMIDSISHKNKKESTLDSLDPVWHKVFYRCHDTTCCYANYSVCWDTSGTLESMETWGGPSAQGGCNIEEGCEPRCSALDITYPEEEKINSTELTDSGDDFVVSPNPNSGEFSLRFMKPGSFDITILNSLGEIAYRDHLKIENKNTSIPLKFDAKAQGVYFLRLIESGNSVFEETIIIEQ